MVCWGSNDSGRLGDGTQIWAQRPVLVRDLTSATSLAAGGQHTCAVSADQTVRCWGSDVDGQLGDGTTLAATPYSAVPAKVVGLEGVTAVAAGQTHTCALPSDASVVCWGSDGYGQLGDDTKIGRAHV